MQRLSVVVLSTSLGLALIGCGKGAESPAHRGEYLVVEQFNCTNCHTPRDAAGNMDKTRLFAGNVDALTAGDPSAGGLVSPSNLTSDATGLKTWTDAEIKNAMLNGVHKDGTPLFSNMPYYELHNLSAGDADAIVAYLRTLPPIANDIPRTKKPTAAAPRPLISLDQIPHTTLPASDANFASAERGRLIAGVTCVHCHTVNNSDTAGVPRDMTKVFAGNRKFNATPSLSLPAVVYSANITPHANGIQGWTAQKFVTQIKTGTYCEPMEAGPGRNFTKLAAQDLLDLGNYFTTIPPVDNGVVAPPTCR